MTIIISKTKLALGVLAMVLIGATVVAAGDGPFTDNPDGTYYHDPVEWAFDNGVTTGTSATTFSGGNHRSADTRFRCPSGGGTPPRTLSLSTDLYPNS